MTKRPRAVSQAGRAWRFAWHRLFHLPYLPFHATWFTPMPTLELDAVTVMGRGPFSLFVAPGATAGLFGPSGSGKSLLLRAAADLLPHGGTIRLDGVPAESIPAPEWRRRVGLLPPDPVWWHDRVGPHLGCPDDDCLRILEQLGFDRDVLGWEVIRLSSGERQRLALARLLARRPKALLLDEPTANLDPENASRIEVIVADYQREHEAPAIWVAHDRAQLGRIAASIHALSQRGLADHH